MFYYKGVKNNKSLLRILKSKQSKIDINHQNKNGDTALILACKDIMNIKTNKELLERYIRWFHSNLPPPPPPPSEQKDNFLFYALLKATFTTPYGFFTTLTF